MNATETNTDISQENKEGHLHPVTILIREITAVFAELGFTVAHGPEIEDEYYNFDALNIPPSHPARDMHDTFWVKGERGKLLRTQTSPVQVRYMETHTPPVAIVAPGKVFRYEATDATHEIQFFQCEGLRVGKHVTLADLKSALEHLFTSLFGADLAMRMRPGYFPFVEPGLEVDIQCFQCRGAGCHACKYDGWLEVLGGGMVHPEVLSHAHVDPREWSGYAFGMGIDRLVMLRYGVEDIRLLYSGDLRFVNQF